jgi:hypothetical protein
MSAPRAALVTRVQRDQAAKLAHQGGQSLAMMSPPTVTAMSVRPAVPSVPRKPAVPAPVPMMPREARLMAPAPRPMPAVMHPMVTSMPAVRREVASVPGEIAAPEMMPMARHPVPAAVMPMMGKTVMAVMTAMFRFPLSAIPLLAITFLAITPLLVASVVSRAPIARLAALGEPHHASAGQFPRADVLRLGIRPGEIGPIDLSPVEMTPIEMGPAKAASRKSVPIGAASLGAAPLVVGFAAALVAASRIVSAGPARSRPVVVARATGPVAFVGPQFTRSPDAPAGLNGQLEQDGARHSSQKNQHVIPHRTGSIDLTFVKFVKRHWKRF